MQINEDQPIGRLDINVSPQQLMFVRYMATSYYTPPPYGLADNILNTTTGGRNNLAQSVTYGHNFVFNSTTLNAFRVAFNRTAIHRTHRDYFSAPEVGVNTYTALWGMRNATFVWLGALFVTAGFAATAASRVDFLIPVVAAACTKVVCTRDSVSVSCGRTSR